MKESVITMLEIKNKLNEIEEVLNMKLKASFYDLEIIEKEWNAFYQEPSKYADSVVVDMIRLWYSEIYPDTFRDAYYLEA